VIRNLLSGENHGKTDDGRAIDPSSTFECHAATDADADADTDAAYAADVTGATDAC
jgi:hypothetical protein